MKETSDDAANAARRILSLFDQDAGKIAALGRPAASVVRVFKYAQANPMFGIASAAEKIGVSFPTAASSVEHLETLGVLQEITGKRRSRLYVYRRYMSILSEGTEPIGRGR